VTLDELNALPEDVAVRELLGCCGSRRWARMMAAARPFASAAAMTVSAEVIWAALSASDWLEAFAAHPRIGERVPSAAAGDRATRWSADEQSGAGDDARARFETRNRDYERRFGHTFIVCATGKSAGEMAAILDRRMENNPDEELREAAEAQRQITGLRIAKLLS
jgi:OHCU decarboxylase